MMAVSRLDEAIARTRATADGGAHRRLDRFLRRTLDPSEEGPARAGRGPRVTFVALTDPFDARQLRWLLRTRRRALREAGWAYLDHKDLRGLPHHRRWSSDFGASPTRTAEFEHAVAAAAGDRLSRLVGATPRLLISTDVVVGTQLLAEREAGAMQPAARRCIRSLARAVDARDVEVAVIADDPGDARHGWYEAYARHGGLGDPEPLFRRWVARGDLDLSGRLDDLAHLGVADRTRLIGRDPRSTIEDLPHHLAAIDPDLGRAVDPLPKKILAAPTTRLTPKGAQILARAARHVPGRRVEKVVEFVEAEFGTDC